MSDSYQALIDCHAAALDTEGLARGVVQALSHGGLILPNPSADCVLDGVGYPAGPQCAHAYTVEDHGELEGDRFWTLKTSGVQIHTTPWINLWGFSEFTSAVCPRCRRDHADDFLEVVGSLVDDYLNTGEVPSVHCSSCHAASSIHDWKCEPHLGFATFSVIFWNWPPLVTENWKVDVHALLEGHLKRPLISTYGRL